MADRFQTLIGGKGELVEATVASTGVAEAGDIVGLDATGKIDPSLLPTGAGPDVASIVVSDAAGLSAGDYVNIFDDTGAAVRLADNSNGRPAHGFVLSAFADAATALVYFEGPNTALSGLTIGSRQYLDTAGASTETPVAVTSGDIHQYLGVAINATTINTDIEDCIRT